MGGSSRCPPATVLVGLPRCPTLGAQNSPTRSATAFVVDHFCPTAGPATPSGLAHMGWVICPPDQPEACCCPHSPYDYVVVDEAQDLRIPQMQFSGRTRQKTKPIACFLLAILGKRIFQTPFSWKAQGVDIRGRSRVLTINYRTSHQIRVQADKLLAL